MKTNTLGNKLAALVCGFIGKARHSTIKIRPPGRSLAFPLALAASALIATSGHAAPGDLDTTFNGTGKVTTAFDGSNDFGRSVAVQADGKILVAGSFDNGSNGDFALVRYNADGSLDTSFNGTGKVTTAFGGSNDFGFSVAVQADGKILVAGSSDNGSNWDFALARYNADGSLDTSFNGTGKVTTDFGGGTFDVGCSVAVQADGKILVAGYSENGSGNNVFALVRYNADGSLDTSFNGTGKVTTAFDGSNDVGFSVAVQADGKILVAGQSYNNGGGNYDFALVRYNADGSLDTSFNGTGKVSTDFGGFDDVGNSVAVQADGKILVAGISYNGSNFVFALVRYNADGSLDTSFNGTGKVTTDFGGNGGFGFSVAVQADGKILVAGSFDNGSGNSDFALARYIGGSVSAPSVTTFHQSKAGLASVAVTGIAFPNGSQTSVWFEYGPDASYGQATSAQVLSDLVGGGGGDRFTAHIAVPGGGTIHYRAVAQNAGGTVYGADATATTGDPANVALEKPVLAASSQNTAGFYAAQNVTDGSTRDLIVQDLVGGAAHNVESNWWMTDNSAGVGGFFVLDLQGGYSISEIRLRNTHDAYVNDAGTKGFHVLASNTVSGSNQLVNPVTILSGTLTDVHTGTSHGDDPIAADIFNSGNGLITGGYRYLEFVIDSLPDYATVTGYGGGPPTNAGGLNAIEVYGTAIPAPSVTSGAASGVGSSTVTLNGTANPNGGATQVYFEYGTSTGYGIQTTGTDIGSGSSAVPVSVNLTGLQGHTTYHYRLVATSFALVSGSDATFTTNNTAPVAVDDKVVLTSGSAVTFSVTPNDTDVDHDTLSVTGISRPSIGTARLNANGSITYTPHFSFLNYAGSDSFTYTISDGHGGTATANVSIYNPFYLQKGNFVGLSTNNGFVTLMLTNNGAFTGKARLGGATYALKGTFDTGGHYMVSLPRVGGGAPVIISLTLDLSQVTGNQGYYTLSGTVDGYGMSAYHVLYNATTNPAPQAGKYTVLLPGNPSYPGSPQGTGYATLTVTEGGGVTMAGMLADGTAFTDGTYLTGGGYYGYYGYGNTQFPVWVPLPYKTPGTLTGYLTFEDVAGVSDCAGALYWSKPAQPSTAPAFYRSGFYSYSTAIGSRYAAPPAGVMGLDFSSATPNATVQLSMGGMASAITKSVTVALGGTAATNTVTVTTVAADNLAMTISASAGTFSGSFTSTYASPTTANPAATTTGARTFKGVLFHKQNLAGGFFTGPTQSGKVSFTPQ